MGNVCQTVRVFIRIFARPTDNTQPQIYLAYAWCIYYIYNIGKGSERQKKRARKKNENETGKTFFFFGIHGKQLNGLITFNGKFVGLCYQ